MDFRAERDTLIEQLGLAAKFAPRATETAGAIARTGLRMELSDDDLRITGGGLDASYRATVVVNGKTDGEAIVPRWAVDVVRHCEPGAVHLKRANGLQVPHLQISSGEARWLLPELMTDSYSVVGDEDGSRVETLQVEVEEFVEALRQVLPAASTDTSRPILTGVCLSTDEEGALRVVATDSYRLAARTLSSQPEFDTNGDQSKTVLLPAAPLKDFHRVLKAAGDSTATLTITDRHARLTVDEASLAMTLIAGDFPSWKALVPTDQAPTVTFDRQRLMDTVARVTAPLRSDVVRIDLASGRASICSTGTESGGRADEVIDCEYDGDRMAVAYNCRYLLEGLDALTGDTCRIDHLDPTKPTILTDDDDRYLHLLMPVRV